MLTSTPLTDEKIAINSPDLLDEANTLIKNHDDYLHGMIATAVTQKKGVLIFSGEFFLDEDGLPTLKTTAVFNMFKHLAHVLSEKYRLVE